MLLLKDKYGLFHNFILADAHTHLKVKDLEGWVPSEFIKRFSKMISEVIQDIKQNGKNYSFEFPWDFGQGKSDYYEYCQNDAYSVLHPGFDLKDKLERFTGFDFIVGFSANMTKKGPRDYRDINLALRQVLTEKSVEDNSPHNNFRFIGFGRVDPNHSDAIDTIDNAHQLGLRGLKLHPREERFDIDSGKTMGILKRAAHYNLPVIFHTQEGMADKVEEIVERTISEFISKNRLHLLPRLKVILGHCPWYGANNLKLYRILSHPNIFGELSTIKPASFDTFFKNASLLIKYERIFEASSFSNMEQKKVEELYFTAFGYNKFNYWSTKLMFGSDTPYPPSHGSSALIKYLLGKKFLGNVYDVRNILGLSTLRLIPPVAVTSREPRTTLASTDRLYHQKQLREEKDSARGIALDPLIESFPLTGVNGGVFTFFKDGANESLLFNSLFDHKKPLNISFPNPIDIKWHSTVAPSKRNTTDNIELLLGEK